MGQLDIVKTWEFWLWLKDKFNPSFILEMIEPALSVLSHAWAGPYKHTEMKNTNNQTIWAFGWYTTVGYVHGLRTVPLLIGDACNSLVKGVYPQTGMFSRCYCFCNTKTCQFYTFPPRRYFGLEHMMVMVQSQFRYIPKKKSQDGAVDPTAIWGWIIISILYHIVPYDTILYRIWGDEHPKSSKPITRGLIHVSQVMPCRVLRSLANVEEAWRGF